MATIYCPNCGSPVMLRGDGWECGWCGDFGDISSLSRPEREKLRAELAAEVLEQGVVSIVEGVQARYGESDETLTLGCKLALYGMTEALIPEERQTPRNLHLLKAFFERHTFCTAAEVLGAAQSGEAAFGDMFSLTGERLGSFWAELPPEDLRGGWLDTVVDGLSAVEGVFTGEEGLKQRLLAILGDTRRRGHK